MLAGRGLENFGLTGVDGFGSIISTGSSIVLHMNLSKDRYQEGRPSVIVAA